MQRCKKLMTHSIRCCISNNNGCGISTSSGSSGGDEKIVNRESDHERLMMHT